jgi:hypothetical protein
MDSEASQETMPANSASTQVTAYPVQQFKTSLYIPDDLAGRLLCHEPWAKLEEDVAVYLTDDATLFEPRSLVLSGYCTALLYAFDALRSKLINNANRSLEMKTTEVSHVPFYHVLLWLMDLVLRPTLEWSMCRFILEIRDFGDAFEYFRTFTYLGLTKWADEVQPYLMACFVMPLCPLGVPLVLLAPILQVGHPVMEMLDTCISRRILSNTLLETHEILLWAYSYAPGLVSDMKAKERKRSGSDLHLAALNRFEVEGRPVPLALIIRAMLRKLKLEH